MKPLHVAAFFVAACFGAPVFAALLILLHHLCH